MARHNRRYILVDNSAEAIRVMAKRLTQHSPLFKGCESIIPAA